MEAGSGLQVQPKYVSVYQLQGTSGGRELCLFLPLVGFPGSYWTIMGNRLLDLMDLWLDSEGLSQDHNLPLGASASVDFMDNAAMSC